MFVPSCQPIKSLDTPGRGSVTSQASLGQEIPISHIMIYRGHSYKPLAIAFVAAQGEMHEQVKESGKSENATSQEGTLQGLGLMKSKMTLPSRDSWNNLLRMPPEIYKLDTEGGKSSLIPRKLAPQQNSKNASGWEDSDFLR